MPQCHAGHGLIKPEDASNSTRKEFIPAPAIETNSCACSECPYMKMNTLEKAYNALYYEQPEIRLEPSVRLGAERALNAMLIMD